MKNKKSSQNIIYYWNAVERFTPHKLDTKNKLGYVESIQQEVLGAKDIPWQSRERFCHKQTPSKTWVYNVFLGVINCTDVTHLIKEMLENREEDYNLQNDNQVSCLCTFQLNNYGEILKDTFAIPDYFMSMACLKQKKKYPSTWMDLVSKIYQKVEDVYNNWADILHNRPNRSVVFEDLKELLADIINVSDITEFHNMVRNNAVIYSSHIPVPNKFKYDKENAQEKFLNITYYEEIMKTTTNSDLNILGSFYIDDIKIVSDTLKDETKTIGIGLKQYLGLIHKDEKYDLRTDRAQIKQLSNPEFLPSSRWPISNKVALSIAQQIAVNLATSETKGLFSVNGPPGTGKSTLLRDIISEVITNRAKVLADFTNPKDAFTNSTTVSIDRFKYKAWSLDSRLLGFDIVIASTNNTAVENISKEIPRLSEIDQSYGLKYFSEIATYINYEECWGLGSAVLGNKTNCSTFFDKFWSKSSNKDSNNEIDDNYGLEYLLTTKKPQSDWIEDRQRFLSTLAEFTELKSELIEFKTRLEEYAFLDFDVEQAKILSQISDISDEIEIYKTSIRNYEDIVLQNTSTIEQDKFQLEETKKLEPRWYIVLLEFFKQESSYQKWSNKCSDILQKISKLFTKSAELKSEILKSRHIISELEDKASNLSQKLKELSDTIKKNNEYINLMKNKYLWSSKIADENFWQLSDKEIQLSSPWIHEKLQDVRARLFVEAMKLHYSFIVNSSEYIVSNLKLIRQGLTFGNWPMESKEMLKHLWAVFFLVVPSVSTTFASFSRLFRGLDEAESLGWLLIDEAGQSAPQEALGAIYRAKRTIVVGDPLQIPPVVTIPKAINNALMKYYDVNENWSVLEESAQTLSDRVNAYGTYINKSGDNQWVGCPLRVHRRCIEPMFSVANTIAYDGLMIQATTKAVSTFDQLYPESRWIDVQGDEFDGHWCKQEGEEVLKILFSMVEQHKSMPDLYVISPFKVVAYKMQRLLKEQSKYLLNNLKREERLMLNKWINKSIGTVHAFQGKQAQGVILLLGGNPSKLGAINWASNYPNILNVALTRAKHKIFVVGNYNLWASKPHFQVLADVICTVNKGIDKCIEIMLN